MMITKCGGGLQPAAGRAEARPHIISAAVLTLFLALPAFAANGGPTTISLSPANPKPGDTVRATVNGIWNNGCPPRTATVSTTSGAIIIDAAPTPCEVACPQVVIPYSIAVTFTAPANVGAFTVEYYSTLCTLRSLDATQRLVVSNNCAFGQSLTVDPPAAVIVGAPAALTWCNPSWTIGIDNAFEVNDYRIYRSPSPSGPFSFMAEVKPATNVRFQFTPDAAGTTYYYVEAHGCLITIAGPTCARDGEVVLVSNIVAVSATNTACFPDATTLCLGDGRFKVTTGWRDADGRNGDGRAVPLTADSGYFWFFGPNNVEVTVKMLNACSLTPPAFWLFASGMTNVEVQMTVVDTKTGNTKRYTNVLGNAFTPILDTNAFSCP